MGLISVRLWTYPPSSPPLQALAAFLLQHQRPALAYIDSVRNKIESAAPGKRVVPFFLRYLCLERDEVAGTLTVRSLLFDLIGVVPIMRLSVEW